jgi:hypothetical protein
MNIEALRSRNGVAIAVTLRGLTDAGLRHKIFATRVLASKGYEKVGIRAESELRVSNRETLSA